MNIQNNQPTFGWSLKSLKKPPVVKDTSWGKLSEEIKGLGADWRQMSSLKAQLQELRDLGTITPKEQPHLTKSGFYRY